MSFAIENNILKGAARPTNVEHKLGQLIYNTLSERPDHVAQIEAKTGERTTCAEMKERSVRCAVWMKQLGIRPDDIVVVVTHNHLDSYIPVFATFFVDAIFSAWNPNVTLYTARRFVNKFTPRLIFSCEQAAETLAEAARLENTSVELVVFGKHSRAQSLNEILASRTRGQVEDFAVVNAKSREDVAAIMLSSGSTGFPKGVMLKTGSLLAIADPMNKACTGVTLNCLWYSTFDWLSGIAFVLQTLLNGNTRIVADGSVQVESFFQTVEKYKVNMAFIPPILVNCAAKSDLAQSYDLRSLITLKTGGSKLSKQILEGLRQKFPNAFISQGYGSTECGRMSFTTPESRHIESTGFVAANYQIKFADLTSGEAIGPNRNGEIRIKTPNIMIGYYKDPQVTKQAFDETGWYRTGDIGFYNEAGEIFIVDRIKDIMKYRNYQISPVEIEELVLSHPEVQEAAVVAIPHELDGDWPAAFVKKAPGSRVTEDELMRLTSVLEDYKKLRGGIYFADDLPKTGSGKIAKNELKQLAVNFVNHKTF